MAIHARLHVGDPRLVRRTLTRTTKSFLVVGDRVRFRELTIRNGAGKDVGAITGSTAPLDGVIEQILPRKTLLTRTDSFKGIEKHPIIANAEQVLLVASIRQPYAKWGLIDRMLIAAQAGGLRPIIALNKIDLAVNDKNGAPPADLVEADAVLSHYGTLGIAVLRTSVEQRLGIEELRALLADKVTVLSGHSGVGKSSLVQAIVLDCVEGLEQLHQTLLFLLARRAGQTEAEGVAHALGVVAGAIGEDAHGQGLGELVKGTVVEQRQCLQRGVRPIAPRTRRRRIRRVERHQRRMRS